MPSSTPNVTPKLAQQLAKHSGSSGANLCAVTLLGNLVAKPDIRYKTNPVSAVTEITLATHTQWLDKRTNQTKEWTNFHHVKVEGDLVDQTLLHANKGDVLLIHGYLSNKKTNDKAASIKKDLSLVHATFVEKFEKGYTQSINQINCSASIASTPKLLTTENNKQIAQVALVINQYVFFPQKQEFHTVKIERSLHLWGKQAQYLCEHAKMNDKLVIEGKLSYSSDADKTQFIHGTSIHLIKTKLEHNN